MEGADKEESAVEEIAADVSNIALQAGDGRDVSHPGPEDVDDGGKISAVELLEKLEYFFSDPEFTDALRSFFEENQEKFQFVDVGMEQPISNYDLYLKYTKRIEDLLEDFLAKNQVTHEDIINICMEEKLEGNASSYCLDYIIASTEYEAFIQMMNDFNAMCTFDVGDDELIEFYLEERNPKEEGGRGGAVEEEQERADPEERTRVGGH